MKTICVVNTVYPAIAAVLLCLDTASGHGGRFRGPAPPNVLKPPWAAKQPPPPAPPNFRPLGGAPISPGPVTGGPTAPGAVVPGPTTPRGAPMPLAIDLTRWQGWWEMNRDRYLLVKDSLRRRDTITGSDDFYMGATRRVAEAGVDRSDLDAMAEKILPALHKALVDASDPNIITACLIGMAKIGRDSSGFKLRDVLVSYLAGRYQEVRETAALALGVSRQSDSLPVLQELLLDTATGRRLVARAEVDRRVRAFAAYGMGILAAHGDSDVRRRVFDVLQRVLADPQVKDRDVRVAVISAIGVLGLSPQDNGKDKLLLWQALPALHKFYTADLGKAAQIVQAHVPIAIARLLGRGDNPDQKRFGELFKAELFARKRRQNSIYSSASIALGLMTPVSDTAASERLFRYFETGRDQQARFFSLISLGEIGGNVNRTRLLKVVTRGSKNFERPWAALGLGVLAFRARTVKGGSVDHVIGETLLRQLTVVKNRDAVGAFAIGLGLSGYTDAAKTMRKMLAEHPHHDGMAGSLCTGLALMGDTSATGLIRQVLHRSVRRPDLLRQAAIALGKLRDRDATRHLMEMLSEDNRNTARMAALAGALQFIGDRRTVASLIELLGDDQLTSLSRAFIAAALGGIADPISIPFNERYARHANYRAVVETLSNQMTGILDLL